MEEAQRAERHELTLLPVPKDVCKRRCVLERPSASA